MLQQEKPSVAELPSAAKAQKFAERQEGGTAIVGFFEKGSAKAVEFRELADNLRDEYAFAAVRGASFPHVHLSGRGTELSFTAR